MFVKEDGKKRDENMVLGQQRFLL